jgi:hypothetical protein
MKTMRKYLWGLVAAGIAALAATSGCVYETPPPPPGGVVVGFVPDYYFWDGFEYVGWYGNAYYYWGPGNVWIICDPVRVQRVYTWKQAHPDWRAHVTANSQPREKSISQPSRPSHPSRGAHGFGRDEGGR